MLLVISISGCLLLLDIAVCKSVPCCPSLKEISSLSNSNISAYLRDTRTVALGRNIVFK